MNSVIKCTSCGAEVDVNDILRHQIEEEVNKKYTGSIQTLQQEVKSAQEKARKDAEFQFNQDVVAITKRLKEEASQSNLSLKKELDEKSNQLRELNQAKADVERLEREKKGLRAEIELEVQRGLSAQLDVETDRIRNVEREKSEMVIRELNKKLEDQSRLTEEMRRKQEQGLTQLQGEVQELAIEEWLATHFPLDTIAEVKKGAFGADCTQVINTRDAVNIGSICYESKRTKEFQPIWIDKLKQDMGSATFGVLVTETLPKGEEKITNRNGIWITDFTGFKGLCFVLRESAIRLHHASQAQENKGEKMQMLYSYLTGIEFKTTVETIVEGFSSMQADLEKEKRAMENIWKQREKQIQRVILSTSQMYGSIKGIAGNAIQSVKPLELG